MSKRGIIQLVLLVFLLSLSTVSALQVSLTPVQSEVLPGQGPTYIIHLINDDSFSQYVTIKTIDLVWMMDKDNTQYIVDAGQTRDVTISYTPRDLSLEPGLYGINFLATTGKVRETKLLPVEVLAYTALVDAQFKSLPVIDPRRTTTVKLLLNNLHTIPMDDVLVQLQSNYFQQQQSVKLATKGSQELSFPITLDPSLQEGTYDLRVKLTASDGHVLVDKAFPFTIGRYSQAKQVVEPQNGVFVTGETVTKKNEGNAVLDEVYSKDFTKFSYMFTSFSPAPSHIDLNDGKKVAVWEFTLAPGQSYTIQYLTNYRTPFFFTVLLLLGIALFYHLKKRDLVIQKKVMVLHTREGGLAVLKVLITVKNTGSSVLQHVELIDRVPHLLKSPTDFGTAKPHVRSQPDSTHLYWEIPHLRKGEERVFSYKIESKTKLPSSLLLPPASAKVTVGKNRVMATSGTAVIRRR
ncbi:hypothetical protein HZB00_04425 [Candidatus Woesearchaeota archaeon]|nr:hypothetical protein [Candidatus Woesearchaeota archaeon]